MLVAYHSPLSWQNGNDAIDGGKPAINGEVEKGLLTLICSDSPGLEVSFLAFTNLHDNSYICFLLNHVF